MPLTRKFNELIKARAEGDPKYRAELLQQAAESFIHGDTAEGKASLRAYINATIGFTALGASLGKKPQSLMRMLSSTGNPTANNLFALLVQLQENEGVTLNVEMRTAGAR